MPANEITIALVPGKVAPRYDTGTELELEAVTITEEATAAGLPLVDLKLRGPDGEFYLAVVTGRILTGIAAAIRGINLRVHGKAEP